MTTTDPSIRVVVADDHPVYRSGLIRAVDSDPRLQVLDDYGDGTAALEGIAGHRPDVAVLDLNMPGRGGVEVIRALRARGIDTRVLVLTGSEQASDLYTALAAGATGFVSKTARPQELCEVICAVARGDVRFPVQLRKALAAEIRAREADLERPRLSEREQEVLRLTADGRSAADIAGDLHLSLPTVRTHLQHLYQKLEVSDRAAAVASGIRLGLID